MLFAERLDDLQVIGIAQRMREHDRLGLGADRGLDLRRIDVIGAEFDIDEYRNRTELQNRIDGGREARRDTDYFVPRTNRALAQLRRGQCREGQKVRRRT